MPRVYVTSRLSHYDCAACGRRVPLSRPDGGRPGRTCRSCGRKRRADAERPTPGIVVRAPDGGAGACGVLTEAHGVVPSAWSGAGAAPGLDDFVLLSRAAGGWSHRLAEDLRGQPAWGRLLDAHSEHLYSEQLRSGQGVCPREWAYGRLRVLRLFRPDRAARPFSDDYTRDWDQANSAPPDKRGA